MKRALLIALALAAGAALADPKPSGYSITSLRYTRSDFRDERRRHADQRHGA